MGNIGGRTVTLVKGGRIFNAWTPTTNIFIHGLNKEIIKKLKWFKLKKNESRHGAIARI